VQGGAGVGECSCHLHFGGGDLSGVGSGLGDFFHEAALFPGPVGKRAEVGSGAAASIRFDFSSSDGFLVVGFATVEAEDEVAFGGVAESVVGELGARRGLEDGDAVVGFAFSVGFGEFDGDHQGAIVSLGDDF